MRHTMFYPQHPMLEDMVQQFFGDAFGNAKANTKYPLTDVYNENGVAYMEIAVAGFKKDEITITVDNESLTIKGEKKPEGKNESRYYVKRDIAKRNFEKSYSLMFPVENVEADVADGILTVKIIPHLKENNVRQIEIK